MLNELVLVAKSVHDILLFNQVIKILYFHESVELKKEIPPGKIGTH